MAECGGDKAFAAPRCPGNEHGLALGDISPGGQFRYLGLVQSPVGTEPQFLDGGTVPEPGTSFQAFETSVGAVFLFGLQEYLQSLGQGQVVMLARFHKGFPPAAHSVQAQLFHLVFDVRHNISVLN